MPDVTVIVVRDPDGETTIQVFDGDVELDHTTISVDAGRGYSWPDWQESRDADLAEAAKVGPALLAAAQAAYTDPPGGEYIDGKPDDAEWLS